MFYTVWIIYFQVVQLFPSDLSIYITWQTNWERCAANFCERVICLQNLNRKGCGQMPRPFWKNLPITLLAVGEENWQRRRQFWHFSILILNIFQSLKKKGNSLAGYCHWLWIHFDESALYVGWFSFDLYRLFFGQPSYFSHWEVYACKKPNWLLIRSRSR